MVCLFVREGNDNLVIRLNWSRHAKVFMQNAFKRVLKSEKQCFIKKDGGDKGFVLISSMLNPVVNFNYNRSEL